MEKIRLFIAAFLLLAAASGCSKENIAPDSSWQEVFPIEISIPQPAVKASPAPDETKVNSLQIYVFRSNGGLEAYGKAMSSKVVTQCTSGPKVIVALANAPDIRDARTKAELDARISDLKANSPGSFVMYGTVSREVSASSGTITIPVTRMVARVSIQKITNRLDLPQYAGSSIQIRRIYLVNAAGNMKYGDTSYDVKSVKADAFTPTVWYNTGACKGDGDLPALLNSRELSSATASPSAPYTVAHYFYCYPNPTATDSQTGTARYTRLVVEVSIDGRLCYYPISIPGIKNNHTYNISELVITHIGSDSPDTPITYNEASFTVTVNPWQDGSDSSVTI